MTWTLDIFVVFTTIKILHTHQKIVKICSISLLGWSNIWPKDDYWFYKAKIWNGNWSE